MIESWWLLLFSVAVPALVAVFMWQASRRRNRFVPGTSCVSMQWTFSGKLILGDGEDEDAPLVTVQFHEGGWSMRDKASGLRILARYLERVDETEV